MKDPHLHPQSWQDLKRLIALHGHEKLMLALRLDQMKQILGEVPEPAVKPRKRRPLSVNNPIAERFRRLPAKVTSKKE